MHSPYKLIKIELKVKKIRQGFFYFFTILFCVDFKKSWRIFFISYFHVYMYREDIVFLFCRGTRSVAGEQ